MHDPLAQLLHDGVIDEVAGRLKSGKEADLWLVRRGGELLAAKVYKARQARSFRNDAAYREGRRVRNTRTQRAMDRGSRFGQAAAEEAWKAKEADALHALHAAGVRVPRPVIFYEGVLVMEVVTDAAGRPAPRLVDAHVPREQAAALYADLRAQAVRMLCCDLVHGDLSPYNVLLGAAGPTVIDFPQVVGAAHNTQAEGFFARDLGTLHRFFAALDPALHGAAGDAREIWRAYARRELTPDFVPSGRGPEAARRHAAPRGEAGHPRGGGAASHRADRRGEPRREGTGPGGPPRHQAERPHGRPHQGPHHAGPGHRAGPPGRPSRPAPAPEVVRVARPPQLAPRQQAAPPRPPPGPGEAPDRAGHAGPGAGGGRRRRRRRR